MKRTIIKIDEELCNGCGACVSGCHEGALQLINNKAVMVSELYCDGLGACIGECPVGAITLEEREAEPYDEKAVKAHGEMKLLKQGIEYLHEHGIPVDIETDDQETPCSCPGAAAIPSLASELKQFPIQLHLLNPGAEFLHRAHFLLAADCTAYACGDFHNRFLKGRALAIACPKLDSNIQNYVDKLAQMIEQVELETLTVLIMEVPCCRGLVKIAEMAREQSKHIPIKIVVLDIGGNIKSEKWI